MTDTLRDLEAKATPGPWRVSDDDPTDVVIWGPNRHQWVANVPSATWVHSATSLPPDRHVEATPADAALIAAARNALPKLLAVVEAARDLVSFVPIRVEGTDSKGPFVDGADDRLAAVALAIREHEDAVREALPVPAPQDAASSNYASTEIWTAALADPKFVAALDEGLADVAAGRVVPHDALPVPALDALPPFDWDQAEPALIEAFTEVIAEVIADNPPDNELMVTTEWAFEVLTSLSDRGYVLVPLREISDATP